ncbi:MAG: VOC family protein [Pseudomonadota bacterium]
MSTDQATTTGQDAGPFPIDRSPDTFKLEAETDIRNRHGAFGWSELATKDPEAAADYYAKVFGWQYHSFDMNGGLYRVITINGHGVGGIRAPMPGEPEETRWLTFVSVKDVKAMADSVAAAGGTVVVPVTELPGIGKMAGMIDPTGGQTYAFEYDKPFF